MIKAANLQLKLTRQQIASQLKINQKEFAIQDKINNVLGKPEQFQAKGRLETQLKTILGPGSGIDVGAPGGVRATQLLDQRKVLEQQKRNLDAEKNRGRANDDLVQKLGKNAEALERNKRATELLANDVSVLSDLERRAAQASRQEQAAIGGILGFSEAIDSLVDARGGPEGVQAFNKFTEPIRALFKASNAQGLSPREARSLIQAIQSGDSRIATLLDNLPGAREQADALKRNVARGLAQSMRGTLMRIGGPAASFAQIPGMLENAIVKAMGEKKTVAQEMREVGNEQNQLLAGTMQRITERTVEEIGNINTQLNQTLGELKTAVEQLHGRRGGVQPDPQKLATGGFVKGH